MNPDVKSIILTEARQYSIIVESDFEQRLDSYIAKHFSNADLRQKLIIETYLTQAALRIARVEGKRSLQGEDLKAAVWLFHQPEQPDDPCAAAGLKALSFESKRFSGGRGILLENFARRLDR